MTPLAVQPCLYPVKVYVTYLGLRAFKKCNGLWIQHFMLSCP